MAETRSGQTPDASKSRGSRVFWQPGERRRKSGQGGARQGWAGWLPQQGRGEAASTWPVDACGGDRCGGQSDRLIPEKHL